MVKEEHLKCLMSLSAQKTAVVDVVGVAVVVAVVVVVVVVVKPTSVS